MPVSDLELLTDAARQAGEIAKRYWQGDNQVWDKGKDDPVSEADYAVDAFLRTFLTGARPDYAWLSEETEDTAARLDREVVFIVDPIDGTRAFVAGQTPWAHSIAIVRNGVATTGVVYLPAKDRLYRAELGQGAFLNGVSISASQAASLNGATMLATRPSFDPKHWPGGVPEVDRHFRPSLAYRLGLVAEGRFDGMLTLRDSWEWDIAAGALVAQEAGAKVTDRLGQDLRFNNPHPKTKGVLAMAPPLHSDISIRLGVTAA